MGKLVDKYFSLLILTAFSYLLSLFRETAVPGPLGIEDISPSMSPDDKSFTRIVPRVTDSTRRADTGGGTLRRSDSPEIPFQTAAGPSDGLDASSPGNTFVGLRVVAKWSSNGYFYSGKITRDVGAGKYKLLFDDGYECDVLGKDILLCDPIPLDTEVTALSEDEYFSAGKRSSVCRNLLCPGAVLSPVSSYQERSLQPDYCSGVFKVKNFIPTTVVTLSIGFFVVLCCLFIFEQASYFRLMLYLLKVCKVQSTDSTESSCTPHPAF